MNRILSRYCAITLVLLSTISAPVPACAAQDDPDTDSRVNLTEQNNLAAMVELSAEQLGISLDYPRDALQRMTLNLRLAESLTKQQLWDVTNRLLVENGYTSVRSPGDELLSIIKLPDASL